MEVGLYRIYDVHDINYYLIDPVEEFYQLKEEIVDSTILSNGSIDYKLYRSKRTNASATWKLDSIWTTEVSTSRIVADENNRSLVKMVFPIQNDSSWDANVYNNLASEYYRYDTDRLDTTLFDQDYMEAVRIIQSDLGQITVGRDDRYEIYAPYIGLIVKSYIVWEYFQENGEIDPSKIVGGRELTQTLIEYGKTKE
ncbi:hypothetical protein BFP72_07560 [Reichenbachiella sp. 5M10]|nr:hypothetical protein BFP72_07560 [Reichenbachiella sp. 5M10]